MRIVIKYNIAIETITKATLVEEDSPYAYTIMGEIYRMIGRLDDAIISFNKSISIEPRPSSYASLGYTYLRKGEFENAVKSFRESIAIRRYSTPICGLSKALIKLKQTQKAMKYVDETLLLAEEDINKGSIYIWPYYNLAFGLLVKNRKKDCLKVLEVAFERNINPEVLTEQLDEYKSMLGENVPQSLLSECIKRIENRIEKIS